MKHEGNSVRRGSNERMARLKKCREEIRQIIRRGEEGGGEEGVPCTGGEMRFPKNGDKRER